MGETAQFIIRDMKEEDAATVVVFCRKCFGKHGSPRRNYLENAAWSWRYRFLVAELEGKVVACMGARIAELFEDYYEAKKVSAHIEVVAVDPDYHGQGIGTKLFAKLLETLANIGIKSAVLQVYPNNTPAIEFYKHFGFEHVSCFERFDGLDFMFLSMEARCTTNSPSAE